MELLKLYRGINNHKLALHRDDEGVLYYTATVIGWDKEPAHPNAEAWVVLDEFEHLIIDCPELEIKPVPLLVATYEGTRRCFETTDELRRYYSGLGIDAARVAEMLDRNVPVIFGRLTAYREKPWHFDDGLTARMYGRQSAL